MKDEIVEFMLEGIWYNELTANVLNGVGDNQKCKMCNQSS